MTVKTFTLFQLRRIASVDIQAIAQTAKQMSEADSQTYLDCIAIGVVALRKGSLPADENDNSSATFFIVTDGQYYFVKNGTFMTTWSEDRSKARRFSDSVRAERTAQRLGRACRVEIIDNGKQS